MRGVGRRAVWDAGRAGETWGFGVGWWKLCGCVTHSRNRRVPLPLPRDAPTSLTPIGIRRQSWINSPDAFASYGANISVALLLQQLLRAEGDHGLLFSRVSWSDGASEDVGISPIVGLDELNLASTSSNVVLHAPGSASNTESFWKVEVAVAASKECISDQVAATPLYDAAHVLPRTFTTPLPVFLSLALPAPCPPCCSQIRSSRAPTPPRLTLLLPN